MKIQYPIENVKKKKLFAGLYEMYILNTYFSKLIHAWEEHSSVVTYGADCTVELYTCIA